MYECRCRLSASLHTETRGRGSGSIATTVAKSYYRLAWKDVQIRSSGKIYMFICFERDVSDANSSNVWTTQKDFSTLFFMVIGVCRELLRFNVFQNCFFFLLSLMEKISRGPITFFAVATNTFFCSLQFAVKLTQAVLCYCLILFHRLHSLRKFMSHLLHGARSAHSDTVWWTEVWQLVVKSNHTSQCFDSALGTS